MASDMRLVDGKGKRRIWAAVNVWGWMFVICGFFFCGGISCEVKEEDEKEVIEFVTAYRKAFSPERIETLADYVDDPESQDFQKDLLRQQAICRHGVIGFENIKVIVCPMSDGKHWIASVSSDLIIQDFDVGMPGLQVVLVGRNEEGELKIELYSDAEYSDAFIKEMRELALTDEIVDHSNEIAMAYNALIAERSDMMEWALETNEAVDREMGKVIEEMRSGKVDSEEEKPTAEKGRYIVKQGDCLWDIAKEQLGDGMLWSSLYERNRNVVGENPDLLYVGITLQL